MEGKDRSTIIVVLVVLVVSFVTLGVLGSLAWGIISDPIKDIASGIGDITKTSNTEYNFDVPDIEAGIALPGSKTAKSNDKYSTYVRAADGEYDYNFLLPEELDEFIFSEDFVLADDILNDQFLANYQGVSGDNGTLSMNISIPKIGVNSPVWQGLNAESLLEQGFWLYPAINAEGTSEVILLCHRRHFGPTDPRTCWYSDSLTVGDSITVTSGGQNVEYKVTETKIHDAGDPNIYKIEEGKDRIRISTCHPLYSNQQRFVVYAERV